MRYRQEKSPNPKRLEQLAMQLAQLVARLWLWLQWQRALLERWQLLRHLELL